MILLIGLVAIAGCQNGRLSDATQIPKETHMQQPYEADLAKLGKFIRLDKDPLNARWQTFEKGNSDSGLGPTDWGLIATIEYDPETIQRFVSQMKTMQIHQDLHVDMQLVQDWFPEAIRSSFVNVPDSKNLMLNTSQYEPTLFMKPPLQHGYCFTSGNWLFLYLQTM
jgi:hypothetical protein